MLFLKYYQGTHMLLSTYFYPFSVSTETKQESMATKKWLDDKKETDTV